MRRKKQVDAIVFSPPFASLNEGAGINKRIREGNLGPNEIRAGGWRKMAQRLSEDPTNIDNIKNYGEVDAIVMSPPYADAKKTTVKNLEHELSAMETGTRPDTKYRHTPGRVRAVQALLSGYSDDERNIGNLAYGEPVAEELHGSSEFILDFPNASSKVQRANWYVPETMAHPAKMPTYLAQWILRRYTKEGETVLDPMAGCATTGVEAMKINRNAILLDLEAKFCDLMRRNVECGKQFNARSHFPLKLGEVKVIQGDSRRLSEVLAENMDAILFSPPYVPDDERRIRHITADDQDRKRGYVPMKGYRGYYSKDERNIGNPRQYGCVDAVVSSPPYSDAVSKQGGEVDRFKGFIGQSQVEARRYSTDPENIGNLPHGKIDTVITSPPFGATKPDLEGEKGKRGKDSKARVKKDYEAPEDPSNISNLKHGSIDAIVTSPPYENAMEGGSRHHPESEPHYRIVREKKAWNYYSDDKTGGQIGNLRSQTYLEAMLQVYWECFQVLKPLGRMILVVKNFIRNKKIVDLVSDTIKLCELARFKHTETFERSLKTQSFWRVNYRKKYPDVPPIDLEHILVFQKPS